MVIPNIIMKFNKFDIFENLMTFWAVVCSRMPHGIVLTFSILCSSLHSTHISSTVYVVSGLVMSMNSQFKSFPIHHRHGSLTGFTIEYQVTNNILRCVVFANNWKNDGDITLLRKQFHVWSSLFCFKHASLNRLFLSGTPCTRWWASLVWVQITN